MVDGLNAFQLMEIEEELEFFLNNMEFIEEPNTAASHYFQHRSMLFFMICLNMFFELLLSIYFFRNKDIIIMQLNEIYRDQTEGSMKSLFEGAAVFSFALDLI